MSQTFDDFDDLRDEIQLHAGFYRSLKGEPDAQVERDRIRQKLKDLKSQLNKMQPLPQWGFAGHTQYDGSADERPESSTSSADSNHSFSTTNQSFSTSRDTLQLSNRKRERPDEDQVEYPVAKSRKPTPQPSIPSRAGSVDIDDFFSSFSLPNAPVVNWDEERRRNKEYFDRKDARRRQEEEDAAFAKQLAEKWERELPSQSFAPQISAFASPNAASTPVSQSYMKPDGSWHKPIPQPAASRIKTGSKIDNTPPGSITPVSDSSNGLEEVTPWEWKSKFGTKQQPKAPGFSYHESKPMISMPGAFPNNSPNPYASQAGSSSFTSLPGYPVYGNSYNPYPGATNQIGNVTMNRGFDMGIPGSFHQPFDLDAIPSPSYPIPVDDYADPVQTQEEIRDLLKHIRPDEELTEEQLCEVQPEGLRIDLMPHQRKGFAWLKSMEEGSNKGGILADDMGLGKTVQALALILGRPPKSGSRTPTLVVAPVALMQQWEREIKKFVKPSHALDVLILHGENRNKSWNYIRDYDVVLTTYGTLASDFKRKLAWDNHVRANPNARPKPAQECPILGDRCKFHRIVLDEAQNIKNKSTKAAAAACRINAEYRWCLSGTPMQNNVDEIYSLIKFCRIRPYHDYEKFARDIGRPLKRTSDWGKEKAMKQLQAILKATLLRRTKKSKIDGQPIIQLPEKHTVEDRAIFSKDELEFYKQLEQQAQIQFNKYLKQGTVGRYYSHALVLLLRLRQCCCSPQLVTNAKEFLTSGPLGAVDHIENAKKLSKDVLRRLDENDAFECPICMDGVENPIIFVPCGHTLCNECLQAMADKAMTDAQAKLLCPHCRAEVDVNRVTDLESYLRVYHPDRPGVVPLEEEDTVDDDDSDSDSESSLSETEEEVEDDGEDLKDFVVPDGEQIEEVIDQQIDDSDADDDAKEPDLKDVLNDSKASETKPTKKLAFLQHKPSKKVKTDKKRQKSKGKGRARNKHISLADLRKEGLKSKAAKKRYLRRLEKGFQTSAKIDRTLEILHEIRDRGLGEKTIIFSSFTSLLDLLEVPLHKDAELSNYTRFDGSMKAVDRNNAVIRFTDDANCKVMLVSLKAGNSGLNLTTANHVIILDPFWNPFVEYQAADRCYRIGQTREVTIHRVLIGESEEANQRTDKEQDFTVEDRILRLQNKKRELVETALDEKAASSLGRLTTRDLGFLFGVNSLD